MTTLNARSLSLDDVHRLLNFQRQLDGTFAPVLSLESIAEQEQQELLQMQSDFLPIDTSKISEGVVKAMTVFPLLRLAGFYHSPVRFSIEEGIAEIVVEDEETRITGRFDILAVDYVQRTASRTPFWILVIEAKERSFSPMVGLAQLLTYAYQSLEVQPSVWGLVATGIDYQFVRIRAGNPPIYQLMPRLSLFESIDLTQLLQVLKAIRQAEYTPEH